MIDKTYRYIVKESHISSLKEGDIIKPIKVIKGYGGWLIGHNYRESMPFGTEDKVELFCYSRIDGRLLARIERIK